MKADKNAEGSGSKVLGGSFNIGRRKEGTDEMCAKGDRMSCSRTKKADNSP